MGQTTTCKVKVKVKGKDVELYSASTCLQDSSNVHFVTETELLGCI